MSRLMASRTDLRIFSMSVFCRERPPRPVASVTAFVSWSISSSSASILARSSFSRAFLNSSCKSRNRWLFRRSCWPDARLLGCEPEPRLSDMAKRASSSSACHRVHLASSAMQTRWPSMSSSTRSKRHRFWIGALCGKLRQSSSTRHVSWITFSNLSVRNLSRQRDRGYRPRGLRPSREVCTDAARALERLAEDCSGIPLVRFRVQRLAVRTLLMEP